MMREFFTKRLGLAFAAGLGLATLASSAQAALITFDLRATSTASTGAVITAGGKAVSFAATGGTNKVSVDVYATIQNTDGNPSNEGFQLLHTGYKSTEAANGSMGNFTTIIRNSAATSNSTSQNGAAANLDGNPDNEFGGTDGNVGTGWNIDSAETYGAMYFEAGGGGGPLGQPEFGTDNGNGTVSFRIARLTWVPSTAGPTPTNLDFLLRNFTAGTEIQQKTIVFYTDAPQTGTDTNGFPLYTATALKPNDANIAFGTPVAITVTPEPASLGLLGLGAMGLLARRRRTA
jgi:hypothetical protein